MRAAGENLVPLTFLTLIKPGLPIADGIGTGDWDGGLGRVFSTSADVRKARLKRSSLMGNAVHPVNSLHCGLDK